MPRPTLPSEPDVPWSCCFKPWDDVPSDSTLYVDARMSSAHGEVVLVDCETGCVLFCVCMGYLWHSGRSCRCFGYAILSSLLDHIWMVLKASLFEFFMLSISS